MITYQVVFQDTIQVIKSNVKAKSRLAFISFLLIIFATFPVGGASNNDFLFFLYASIFLVFVQNIYFTFCIIVESPDFLTHWIHKDSRVRIVNAKFIFSLRYSLFILIVLITFYIYSFTHLTLKYDFRDLLLSTQDKILIILLFLFSFLSSYAFSYWLVGRFIQFERISLLTGLPVLNLSKFIYWVLFLFLQLMITFAFGANAYNAIYTNEIKVDFLQSHSWLLLLPCVLFNIILPVFLFFDGREKLLMRDDFTPLMN